MAVPRSRIAIISDTHGYQEPLELILERLDKENIPGVFCLGDIMSGGQAVEQCVRLFKQRGICVIAGNHDKDIKDAQTYGDDVVAYVSKIPRDWQTLENGRRYGFFHENPLPVHERYLGRHPFTGDIGIKTIEQADYCFNRLREQAYHVMFVGHVHAPRGWMFKKNTTTQLDVSTPIKLDPDASYILGPGSVAEPKVFTQHSVANPRPNFDGHYGILDFTDLTFSIHNIPLFRDRKTTFIVKKGNERDYR